DGKNCGGKISCHKIVGGQMPRFVGQSLRRNWTKAAQALTYHVISSAPMCAPTTANPGCGSALPQTHFNKTSTKGYCINVSIYQYILAIIESERLMKIVFGLKGEAQGLK